MVSLSCFVRHVRFAHPVPLLSPASSHGYRLIWAAGLAALGWLLVPVTQSLALSPMRVVTTVAPLANLVKQVGGGRIELRSLVPQGGNAHIFQPTPRDVQHIAEADLIILNGLSLDVSTEKLALRSGRPGMTILKLGDNTIHRPEWLFDVNFPEDHGHPNPHLWLNVAYAMRYVELVRDSLRQLDPEGRRVYEDNAAQSLESLSTLDRCIAQAVDTIPRSQRKLVTYHDSWPYFARRYGMTVLAAIQPASLFEPSPREVARIIEQLRHAGVPAVFGSEVFPSKVLEKIAAETGVRYVTTLHDDVLPGHPGDIKHSYIGMMLQNVNTIVESLGGRVTTLRSCTDTLLGEAK